MIFFKPAEVIEFALKIEKNGAAFYNTLAEKVEDSDARNVFSFMAKEEVDHFDTFEKMLSKVSAFEPFESYPGEYAEYVRELVDGHVFAGDINPAELAGEVKNAVDAVNLALGFEKDSIIFFHELRKLVPEPEQRGVDELIAEEGRHVKKLLQLKKLLAGKC